MKQRVWLNMTHCFVILVAGGCSERQQTAGIEGSGIKPTVAIATAAYGRITGFGSIIVNGVDYDTTDASVSVNGHPGALTDLAAGQVVSVTGTLGSTSATTGVAENIRVDFAVAGPVQSIDIQNSAAVVLGQTVRLVDSAFDTSVPQQSIVGLTVGDFVRVSGFRDQRSQIIASWIGKPAGIESLVARGVISNFEPAVGFDINGLHVNYPSITPNLANGDVVEVRGALFDADTNTLVANEAVFQPTDVFAQAGDYVHMEGYLTGVDSTEPRYLEIAGLPITLTDTTRIEGQIATDTRAEAKGVLATDGALLASKIASDRAVASASGHTITGVVFDAYDGPVANVAINVWISLPTWGYSWWWANQSTIVSDSFGRFSVPGIPDSQVWIEAAGWSAGYVQPCAVTLDLSGDVTRDIEVVSTRTLNSFAPPRPLWVSGPTAAGTVYEVTEGGTQPVPDVLVEVSTNMVTRATTRTDLSGNYFVCDLQPPGVAFDFFKDGYVTRSVWPVDLTQEMIDIEIERD